jgi:hypothetical protein
MPGFFVSILFLTLTGKQAIGNFKVDFLFSPFGSFKSKKCLYHEYLRKKIKKMANAA